MANSEITPVLLSGGGGTRLWPISRSDIPKQFQALVHSETLFQATVLRATGNCKGIAFAAPVVVAGERHRFLVAEQLQQLGVDPDTIILEPVGRNTALAIALAAEHLVHAGKPDAILLVMPSDHIIADLAAFHDAVRAAMSVAEAGQLVTFGVTPTGPATGYGYIQPVEDAGTVRQVKRFVEKPNALTAASHVSEGYLWNAGIFLFRASAYLAELQRYAPEIADAGKEAMRNAVKAGMFLEPERHAFEKAPAISVDFAVMEHCTAVSVVPVAMGWSDVGSWDALCSATSPDADGNVVLGAAEFFECRETLFVNAGGPLVTGFGLEGMVVVATADALLVAPRSRSEEVRKIVDRIEAGGLSLASTSHEVRRPWGSYQCLDQGDGWQVKRITVKPGGRLSLQKHAHRAETWVVASGSALVTVDASEKTIGPGESVSIPIGAVHRLENQGTQPLELIEVQQGGYLGEDDIVRLADIYGRSGTNSA